MKKLCALLLAVLTVSAAFCIAAPAYAAKKPKIKVKLKLKNTDEGILISWNKVKAKNIKLQRGTAKEKYKTIKKIKNKTEFLDKKVEAGKKYCYRLYSKKKFTVEKSFVRLTAPEITNIGYDKTGMGIIWSKTKGAKEYEVYKAEVKDNKTGKYQKIKTVKTNSLDCYGESTKKTFKYKVRALSGSSQGLYSKPVKYEYIKRAKEGFDYSYKSKYADITYSDIPYYEYADPLNKQLNLDKKSALARNESDFAKGFEFRSFENGVEIANAPFEKTITIPDEINGKPVLKLGGSIADEGDAKRYHESTWETDAEKIIISKNVRDIVSGTFSNMNYLEEIEVSEDNPYYSSQNGILYNKDKTVLLFVPISHLGETIDIPATVKKAYSLFSTETEILNIPKSLTKIAVNKADNTFYNPSNENNEWVGISLTSVNVDMDNPNYSDKDGILYDKKKSTMYLYPYNKPETELVIPDSVEAIGNILLDHMQNIKSITFNKKVKSVGFTTWRGSAYSEALSVNVYKDTPAHKWAKAFNKGSIKINVLS